jgi:hypothetical protein
MDIASGIAAVTQGLGIAKALRGIEKTYDQATYRAEVAEVIESLTNAKLALTDAKLALAEANEGLAKRDREIERLNAFAIVASDSNPLVPGKITSLGFGSISLFRSLRIAKAASDSGTV